MLADWLFQISGMSLFEGRLFRAGAASLSSIIMVMLFMPYYIRYLQGLDATSDFEKKDGQQSPPIMGGLLLVVIVVISTLFFAHLNSYVISTLVILIAYSAIGAVDDIAKIRNKRLVAQGKLTKADYMDKADGISSTLRLGLYFFFSIIVAIGAYKFIPEMKGYLTIPFIPVDLWHPYLPNWAFIAFMSFIITATANGTNFTDGLDSLVSVPIITSMTFVGLVAYISGNIVFADYLHIPYLPGSDELFPLAASIVGALLAYLWFNSPPAQIYMGDAGSVGFGGAIGIMFILIRAELFIPLVAIIIIIEALSVVLQISWFKLSKGKRLFLCAPIHHHYQFKWKDLYPSKALLNSKIVWRMHIISLFALIVSLIVFFKIR
jgi:phospho-N-acetylmuramoyl-pentapeptide-transferase